MIHLILLMSDVSSAPPLPSAARVVTSPSLRGARSILHSQVEAAGRREAGDLSHNDIAFLIAPDCPLRTRDAE
jgi:hypothetical protein